MIKYIHIDYRKPRTQVENECWAITDVKNDTACMFVNINKNRTSKALSDTFFHEMAHVFMAFHGKEGQISEKAEETLAMKIGQICAEALK